MRKTGRQRTKRGRKRERSDIADTLRFYTMRPCIYVLGTAIGVTLYTTRPCNSLARHARRTPGCLIDCLHIPRAPVPRTQTAFCMKRSIRTCWITTGLCSMVLKTSQTHRRKDSPTSASLKSRELSSATNLHTIETRPGRGGRRTKIKREQCQNYNRRRE